MEQDRSFQQAMKDLKNEILHGTNLEQMGNEFSDYMLTLTPFLLKALERGETVESVAAHYADTEQEKQLIVTIFRAYLFRGLLEASLQKGLMQKPLYDELLAFVRDLIPGQ